MISLKKSSTIMIPWTPIREKLIRVTCTPTLIYVLLRNSIHQYSSKNLRSLIPTSSHPMADCNLLSRTAIHSCVLDPESSDLIQTPQTSNPVEDYRVVSEPNCAVCLQSCSNAHLCPECYLPPYVDIS